MPSPKIPINEIKVTLDQELSKKENRFIILNPATGKIIDDAQGYGYKSIQGAYRAYTFKFHNPAKKVKSKSNFKRKIMELPSDFNKYNQFDPNRFFSPISRPAHIMPWDN
jgi:hypothetical protein